MRRAGQKQCEYAVIGINDYLTFDGYEKILEYRKNGRLTNIELFLPVIELRLEIFVGSQGHLARINYHVIFSDQIDIETLNEKFLKRLLHPGFKVAMQDGSTREWKGTPQKAELEGLGRLLIESAPADQRKNYGSPLIEGFKNLNYPLDCIEKCLSDFSGKYMTALGKTEWDQLKWSDSTVATKKSLMTKADLLFVAAATPEDWERSRSKLIEQKVNSKLFDCSDAHCFSDSSELMRVGNCNLWIKAAQTFDGLKTALHEFNTRVYCGQLPPKLRLVQLNQGKYIDSIKIEKISSSTLTDTWFQNELEFSSDLIAIIGNKGSGKSALADSLGLTGNCHQKEHFAFLNDDKFCQPRANKGDHFLAEISWKNGFSRRVRLSDDSNREEFESVKYIPQKYLDELCEEIPSREITVFEEEIRKVIFSHVAPIDRLHCTSLEELIEYQTSETEAKILDLRNDLKLKNKEIVDCEVKLLPAYRSALESQLLAKRQELVAIEAKPLTEVHAPPAVIDSVLAERLSELSSQKQILEVCSNMLETREENLAFLISNSEKLIRKIENFHERYLTFENDCDEELTLLSLDFEDLVRVSIDVEPLRKLISSFRLERRAIEILLDPTPSYESTYFESEDFYEEDDFSPIDIAEASDRYEYGIGDGSSIAAELMNVEVELRLCNEKLDEPNQQYRKYLSGVEEWNKQRELVIGKENQPDTIKYFEHLICLLDQLPVKLEQLKAERLEIVSAIHSSHCSLANAYKKLFSPVQEFIDSHELAKNRLKLDFHVSIIDVAFEIEFFRLVQHGTAGSFCGKEEGTLVLRKLLEKVDFNSLDSTLEFLQEILHHLQHDIRANSVGETVIEEQLRKNVTREILYDLVFSLDFLRPSYSLQLAEKELKELSPGERGLLLLVFYLLIDKGDIPLIIDQPEENLDNQTVYELLVPCIREAKSRRQVFIVTHNPNLAVVCDAEQIIHCSINKMMGNEVSYVAGPIESREINRLLLDILEGTEPAFDNRNSKYYREKLIRV